MTNKKLLQLAQEAREKAYAPYSNFKVGAALLSTDGLVFTGCNIENAAYSPTNCAERTAIFKAVSQGVRNFAALAVIASTEEPVSPCGVCRQVMAEFFSPDTLVILGNLKGDYTETTLRELLPGAFTANELKLEGEIK